MAPLDSTRGREVRSLLMILCVCICMGTYLIEPVSKLQALGLVWI